MEKIAPIPKITSKIKNISTNPGVYLFYDKKQEHLYVGKAKNLRKRIASYFTKYHRNTKIYQMVKNVHNIECILVNTEQDALLLENNLIKKYQPRYNVMFKDGKSYPWICIKKEHFPRVLLTRNIIKDGSMYFGPYTSVIKVKHILNLLKTLYKLRTCNYSMTPTNIKKKKFKRCLEYHLKNCNAPCENLQTEEEYDKVIKEIKRILNGNLHFLIKFMENKMQEFAANLMYEDAQKVKEKIIFLKNYQGRSVVVSPTINKMDVYSYIDDENNAYINFLKISKGAVSQSYTLLLKKKINESKEDLLTLAIFEIRQKIPSNSTILILPFSIDYQIDNVKYEFPKRGEKLKLLNLSKLNAMNARKEKLRLQETMNKKNKGKIILQRLQKDLRLKHLPTHIECFDNSNFQGSIPVAACVVFKNAKPSKKDYRHYNIKTVEGIDDFFSMTEIVNRRYKRLQKEKKELPQLIIIDGGKGQLNAAIKSLKNLKIYKKVSIIGIAKRLEEIFFAEDSFPLRLDKKSKSLQFIQHIRNETHRFGISFHRQKRSIQFLHSELTQIKGIGQKSAEKLLTNFHSVKIIQQVDVKEIAKIIGKEKAKLVASYFKKKG